MNVFNLESLEGLPNIYIEKLSSFRQQFLDYEFLENLENNHEIQELIFDINKFCFKNYIIGFHYTRASPEHILEKGLLSRPGEEIRKTFLMDYGKHFNSEEINVIQNAWKNGFDDLDKEVRDNWIYFNFTKEGLRKGGADLLLKNFGGEQVYAPIYRMNQIASKIQNLGVPLILKCTLLPNNIKTLIENPWGKIAMSSFHRTINTEAAQLDQDGRQKISVSPELIEIVEM